MLYFTRDWSFPLRMLQQYCISIARHVHVVQVRIVFENYFNHLNFHPWTYWKRQKPYCWIISCPLANLTGIVAALSTKFGMSYFPFHLHIALPAPELQPECRCLHHFNNSHIMRIAGTKFGNSSSSACVLPSMSSCHLLPQNIIVTHVLDRYTRRHVANIA